MHGLLQGGMANCGKHFPGHGFVKADSHVAVPVDKRSLKELLVRLIYVEMLGHDASWGHVQALQACSDKALLTKKVRA